MVERKGIEHRMVWLLPGLHPMLIRARGFRGGTVPAMRLDGRRFQHSRAISRALEEAQLEPRLFPEDPEHRLAVEEAERWGEEELQLVPRRIYRWIALRNRAFRAHLAAEIGLPAPKLAAAANEPVARYMARKAGADDAGVRATLLALPTLLDRVDALLAEGTIGGEPNAADFQIVTSVRCLLCHDDIAPLIEGRAAASWARRLMPEYPGTVPASLPPDWLQPLR
jgi:glutathione S-transferase